jgi:gliding motility-associated-like protein
MEKSIYLTDVPNIRRKNKQNVLIMFLPLWIFSFKVLSQNLVSNSSFENIKSIKCSFSTPNQNLNDYVNDWSTPTIGSTDIWFYDSTNNKNCSQNLFINGIRPRSGQICLGLYSFSQIARNYREYAQVKLNKPLVKGKSYIAKFYVLLNKKLSSVSSNKLGMYFSADAIKAQDPQNQSAILAAKQSQVYEEKIIHNNSDWVEIKSCFTATESFNYLTIGNFFTDEETSVSQPNGLVSKDAYYFVDDVSVEELTFDLPTVNLGNDTTLCSNQTLTFKFDNQNYKIQWQDGSNDEIYEIKSAGKFWISLEKAGCLISDTLNVKILPLIKLIKDTLICQGEVLNLNPHYNSAKLIWSTGSEDSTLAVSQSGNYWVKVNTLICNISDTISVQVVECVGEIPNVFTPNNDGKNEVFYIQNVELSNWRLQIYNRWGMKVKDDEPYKNDWRGENLPSGLYYYYLTNRRLNRKYKGWVQILR